MIEKKLDKVGNTIRKSRKEKVEQYWERHTEKQLAHEYINTSREVEI